MATVAAGVWGMEMRFAKVSCVAAAFLMSGVAVSCSDSDGQAGSATTSIAGGVGGEAVEVPTQPTPAVAGRTYQATLGSSRVSMTMPSHQGLEIARAPSGNAFWVSLRTSTFSATVTQGFLDNNGQPLPSTPDGVTKYLQTIEGLSTKEVSSETIGGKKATTVTFEHKGADATLWSQRDEVFGLDTGQVGKLWVVALKGDLLIFSADYYASHNPEDDAAFALLAKSVRFD